MGDYKQAVDINSRDRVMRAWENSMELVRDYRFYAREVKNESLSELFDEFAEDECRHAAKFNDILQKMEKEKK